MIDAKNRAYKIGKKVMSFLAVTIFIILMLFAPQIAKLLLGDLSGGNTIQDVSAAIRAVSFAILVIPFLSVLRGYLQGNKYLNDPSYSQLIEQIARIIVVLVGSYVAINLLHYSVPIGVSVALSGTVLGGIAAFIFLNEKYVAPRINAINIIYQ